MNTNGSSTPLAPSSEVTPKVIPVGCHGVVVLTGASTGIGFATAIDLVQRGYFVYAGIRRSQDAERLLAQVNDRTLIEAIYLDICDEGGVRDAANWVRTGLSQAGLGTLTALINNAGIALGGPLLEIDIDLLRRQLEVNVTAQLTVIQSFVPLLATHSFPEGLSAMPSSPQGSGPTPGRIIQVSSISGVRAMPFVGPYTASKFGLEGLCDSLRMELMPLGIDVIIVQPGPINTEIWDKAPTPETSPFKSSPYRDALERFYQLIIEGGRKGLPPSSIAKVIYRAISARRPKTRYVKTPGYLSRYVLPLYLPTRSFDRIVARMLNLSEAPFRASGLLLGSESDAVGGAVVGGAVVGDAVVGDAVVGDAVVGDAVVGDAVVDGAVVDEDANSSVNPNT